MWCGRPTPNHDQGDVKWGEISTYLTTNFSGSPFPPLPLPPIAVVSCLDRSVMDRHLSVFTHKYGFSFWESRPNPQLGFAPLESTGWLSSPDPRIRARLIKKISGSARVAASCIVVGGARVQYFAMIIIVNGRDDHNAHQSYWQPPSEPLIVYIQHPADTKQCD